MVLTFCIQNCEIDCIDSHPYSEAKGRWMFWRCFRFVNTVNSRYLAIVRTFANNSWYQIVEISVAVKLEACLLLNWIFSKGITPWFCLLIVDLKTNYIKLFFLFVSVKYISNLFLHVRCIHFPTVNTSLFIFYEASWLFRHT